MLPQRSSRLLSCLSRGAFRSPVAPLSASLRCRTQRPYSIHADKSVGEKIQDIDPTKLSITKTTTPKDLLPHEELVFGRNFSDHMLSLEWTATEGWLPARITPYQNLSLDPATCVFHYAFECFEGMKAYKDKNGNIRLFRPDKNMARLNKSSARIALPTFDPDALIELIGKFVKEDERFVPDARGYSLYLRPTMIGTQRTLGVGPPASALLYVIASPVGPYYPTGFKAISLEATDYAVRAWPGGVGDKKLGANYAPCIVPQMQAASRGFHQNLWLFGEEEFITEVGTMNLFAAIKNKETGKPELLTAPLDGTILEGVTRDSILELARERLVPKGWTVSERKFTMKEVADAANEGRMMEIFGAGTAAIVAPVRKISWKGQLVDCGLEDHVEAGPIAQQMKDWMEAIQYGDEDHPWSYKVI
ncbi:branched-chain-amino-acid transaminase bat2 [Alternaria metachromatica]|uniref:branched-chain-amino-acid transaminase bat2 n=1 Tax=Alternaria metachromatica TaxID=283354 RepID=UPI0020C45E91|nr:branched-chain-amino-acid transaminase bat2 [Alternaria metachromatica]XP_049239849.1 branched-chain-amino-acid transaminase bat2 [Alternaria hordeiaustralica]XP_051297097.1 branched-chain-amino-acid transaminase bat2 [Alternaria arbusti]KAI4610136.1 branched-chain-amino-acid transaminase bat2 [Alternaria metachromatica]KAI4675907.1 branched-chain-amino-acid transaminase bat2 [Alternaria hordeiaustralica]KAI4938668.1 branched-chain-amino-acid transaminase bat2 [Alternaria arbusti]